MFAVLLANLKIDVLSSSNFELFFDDMSIIFRGHVT